MLSSTFSLSVDEHEVVVTTAAVKRKEEDVMVVAHATANTAH
jgi:hypothetical protein